MEPVSRNLIASQNNGPKLLSTTTERTLGMVLKPNNNDLIQILMTSF